MGDMHVDSRATILDTHSPVEHGAIRSARYWATEAPERQESWPTHALNPAVGARRGFGRVYADVLRRSVDVIAGAVGLVVLAPMFALIALLVRLETPGDPIYGSWRLTTRGRRFRCWKFRTMHSDSDQRLAQLLASAPDARLEFERFHKLGQDPRVTRIGRLLRASSLDEIPQLFNVLVGEMSLVGPRPYLVRELQGLPERHDILAVKPGITGLWQVSGRNELTFRQRLRIELFYSRRQSLGWDAALLARTVSVVVRRRGAR